MGSADNAPSCLIDGSDNINIGNDGINKATISELSNDGLLKRLSRSDGENCIIHSMGHYDACVSPDNEILDVVYPEDEDEDLYAPQSEYSGEEFEDQQQEDDEEESEWEEYYIDEDGKYELFEDELADLLPDDYWSKTAADLFYVSFDCEPLFETSRPVHDSLTWSFLRGVYAGVMTASPSASASIISANAQLANATPRPLAGGGTGFRKRILAKQSLGKGRGVFADELIRKGDLVWSASAHTGRFPNGRLYRRFLAAIPPDVACDVLQWAYVQRLSISERENDDVNGTHRETNNRYHRTPSTELNDIHPTLRISVDLDEGSFMNDDAEDPNIGCIEDVKYDCHDHYFALRDIQVGEELLCSYGLFAITNGWEEFGL